MQLQKSPVGLLGAFALKVLGRNPPQFGEAVQPVVDVYDQYLSQGELRGMVQSGATIVGNPVVQQTLSVPRGKCWRVIGAGGFVSVNVADVALIYQGTIAIGDPTGSAEIPVFTYNLPQLGVNGRNFGCTFRPPLFIPSGWNVAVTAVASANPTVAGTFIASVLVQEFDL